MDYEQLSKFFAGELTSGEKETLLDSLEANEEHLKEAAKLKNSWAAAQLAVSPFDKEIARKGWEKFYANINRKKYLTLPRWHVAVAASLAGVIIATALFFNMRQPVEIAVAYHTLTAPTGQYAQLTLADGSEIWLNSRSKLTYPERFTSAIREIELEGEGLFHVAADSKRPFVVKTGALDVVATGTQFNVSAYPDDEFVVTTLVEGVVTLLSTDKSVDHIMEAGQIAIYDKPTNNIALQNIDVDMQTSWVLGEYRFREMTLEQLVKRMERYFDITFVFHDDALKQQKFTGTFYSRQSVETTLKVIEATTDMRYTIENGVVYIK